MLTTGRDWHNPEGIWCFWGTYISQSEENGKVKLRDENARVWDVLIHKLSEDDQRYVAEMTCKQKRQEHARKAYSELLLHSEADHSTFPSPETTSGVNALFTPPPAWNGHNGAITSLVGASPTNHVYIISERGELKANDIDRTFLIDPTLDVPIPKNIKEDRDAKSRKNLKISLTRGNISARVSMIGDPMDQGKGKGKGRLKLFKSSSLDGKRGKLHLQTWRGNIGISIRREEPMGLHNPVEVYVRAWSPQGDSCVIIELPPSFHGIIKTQALNDATVLSDPLLRNTTTFSETSEEIYSSTDYFVGDFDDWAGKGGEWKGDVVHAISHGRIDLRYVEV